MRKMRGEREKDEGVKEGGRGERRREGRVKSREGCEGIKSPVRTGSQS